MLCCIQALPVSTAGGNFCIRVDFEEQNTALLAQVRQHNSFI
jgi:hypothetical protein